MKKSPRAPAKRSTPAKGAKTPVKKAVANTRNTVKVTTKPSTPHQAQIFESAMKLFHARDFAAAKDQFEKAATGPNREMAHVARTHIRMCEQRIDKGAQPDLRGPEDQYHFAIGLINQRKLDQAEELLKKAIAASPKADYAHYALAICRGLQGDLDDAKRYLEQAIRLDPKNKVIARGDPDFLEFGKQSPLREMVFSEKKDLE
jgi:Tfp pilus assembly protein PilF